MSKVEGDGSGGGPAGGAGVEEEVMWKDGLLAGGWGVEVLDICDGEVVVLRQAGRDACVDGVKSEDAGRAGECMAGGDQDSWKAAWSWCLGSERK